MLEAIVLVLVLVIIVLGFFTFSSIKEKAIYLAAERTVVSAKERLKIAERRYRQGKMNKSVFDSIADDLESELYSAELQIFRMKTFGQITVDTKATLIVQKLDKPTNHRKSKIESILRETEIIRHEMSLLEAKLLKREIKETVFEKLIKERESEIIKKEKELMDVVIQGSNNFVSASLPKQEEKKESTN
jgi:hypothetical protein